MLLTKESVLGIVQLCSYPMNYIGNVNFSTCVLGMGNIDILIYDYCKAKISRLSRLLLQL